MTWSLHSARHVQARLAGALIPPLPLAELGDITLLPHQRDAVARIQRAIRLHHGALLADDVGLGKTYTALAVARSYTQVHVIAPAALQAMWRTAITHAQLPNIRLHSVHGFSRPHHASRAALADEAYPGVVRERAPQLPSISRRLLTPQRPLSCRAPCPIAASRARTWRLQCRVTSRPEAS